MSAYSPYPSTVDNSNHMQQQNQAQQFLASPPPPNAHQQSAIMQQQQYHPQHQMQQIPSPHHHLNNNNNKNHQMQPPQPNSNTQFDPTASTTNAQQFKNHLSALDETLDSVVNGTADIPLNSSSKPTRRRRGKGKTTKEKIKKGKLVFVQQNCFD